MKKYALKSVLLGAVLILVKLTLAESPDDSSATAAKKSQTELAVVRKPDTGQATAKDAEAKRLTLQKQLALEAWEARQAVSEAEASIVSVKKAMRSKARSEEHTSELQSH